MYTVCVESLVGYFLYLECMKSGRYFRYVSWAHTPWCAGSAPTARVESVQEREVLAFCNDPLVREQCPNCQSKLRGDQVLAL